MERKHIYQALADFQQECPVLLKGTSGYNYQYIKFEHLVAQVNPILKKHNLGFTQLLENTGLRTILFHTTSGETIDTWVDIPHDTMKGMNVFQTAGSGITYYKRYSLSAMLGIISDSDTDANIYSKAEVKQEEKPKEVEHWVLDIGDEKWDKVLTYITQNKKLGLPQIVKNLQTGNKSIKYTLKTKVKKELAKHI